MLIESPTALLATCISASALLNLVVLKFSPEMKQTVRHLFTGVVPTMGALGMIIGPNDSVVAYGTDLLVLGASVAGGIAAAIGSTKYVTPQHELPRS